MGGPVADHWCKAVGGSVPEPVRANTAAARNAFLAPVLDHYAGLPAAGRSGPCA